MSSEEADLLFKILKKIDEKLDRLLEEKHTNGEVPNKTPLPMEDWLKDL